MLQEILNLGFEHVELGHGIRLSLMEGIQRYYDAGKIHISSLHNFCPLPVEITRPSPDCYQFSSYRDSERERAVKLSFQTIDFARRLGARFVVLHLGSVPIERYTDQLTEMAEQGEYLSRKYVKLKIKAVEQREKKVPACLERSRECLKRIVDYAAKKEIKLGVEGRQGYEEIPSEMELTALLDEINAPDVIGYWHDFGHIQIKENLGFVDHAEWLAHISPRMLGGHLHDTEWPGHDHRPPFTGNIDYDKLIPYLPRPCLLVWEMGPRRKAEEVTESLLKWKAKYGDFE
ncbi:MAG TPA: TIM barrel protein [Chthoniobacteraceae bacterium]|jgi:sugar phosphate isomerase/epimerase|nr:TIM barrel protein [Chthoniobacteraceae bacterium]